jgi:hypothetical protein
VVLHHRHDWTPADGTIVEIRMEPTKGDPFFAARTYVVDLRPVTGEPRRAEVRMVDRDLLDIHQPTVGDVRGFKIDTKTGKVEMDHADPRNNLDMRLAAADAGQAVPGDYRTSGLSFSASALGSQTGAVVPKWVVPVECPNCGARVEQAVASMEDNPHCGFCHEPLPVQPYQQQFSLAMFGGDNQALLTEALSAMTSATTSGAVELPAEKLEKAAAILRDGEPVGVTLVSSMSVPGVTYAGGLDMTALVLQVTPPSGTGYQINVGSHVPDQAKRLLVAGAALPAKALAGQPHAVAIDWDAALAASGS